nr:MAG TPA: hypothetical protein [Caudoviricetes sp.]
MINAEKYRDEILVVTNKHEYFALKADNPTVITRCNDVEQCRGCLFDNGTCSSEKMKWLLSEYKEPIKLTRLEYDILKYLSDNTKHMYIVRNKDGKLCIFDFEPVKNKVNDWWSGRYMYGMVMFNKLFQFVQWEDSTPTLIKDVLENCEVVDND